MGITASEKNIRSGVVIYNSNVVNKDWDSKENAKLVNTLHEFI